VGRVGGGGKRKEKAKLSVPRQASVDRGGGRIMRNKGCGEGLHKGGYKRLR